MYLYVSKYFNMADMESINAKILCGKKRTDIYPIYPILYIAVCTV